MSKPWYSYFVSVDEAAADPNAEPGAPQGQAPPVARTAAQSVAEIAAGISTPAFGKPITDPASFDQIYEAAEIRPPAHGFTIFKIADMLKSEHIRSLPVEIKRSSVLLALDAAGVKLQEIIEDAVRRDRALDTFETGAAARAGSTGSRGRPRRTRSSRQEADRVLNELRARIQANNDEVAKERERMQTWRLQKQQEERRIADAVAPFVSENPITTGPAAAPAKPEQDTRPASREGGAIHVQAAVANVAFVLRILHLRRGGSRADPRAEHSRHERPGAADEREHRDGQGQRDAARKGGSQVQDRSERPDDQGEGRHPGGPRRSGRALRRAARAASGRAGPHAGPARRPPAPPSTRR